MSELESLTESDLEFCLHAFRDMLKEAHEEEMAARLSKESTLDSISEIRREQFMRSKGLRNE